MKFIVLTLSCITRIYYYDAQVGLIDSTFGTNGKTTSFGWAWHIAVQSNNKILIAWVPFAFGTTKNNFGLSQFTADGKVDTAYGINGRATGAGTLNNIKATNSDYGCCSFLTIPVNIEPITIANSQNCCNYDITLSLSPSASCYSDWQWYKDAAPIAGATNTTLTFNYTSNSNGIYTASYNSTSIPVFLTNSYTFSLPTYPVNYNWAQYLTNCCRTETENEIINSGSKIHPNPNEGTFILEANEFKGEDVVIEVYNLLGTIIYKTTTSDFKGNINLKLPDKISEGVYLTRIISATKSSQSKFIVDEAL